MGDLRFGRVFERVASATDRARAVQDLGIDDLIMALAASSTERDPFLVNVMATELQNRARRAMAVAEHIGEAVAIIDEAALVTYVNPVAQRLLGRHASDVVGLHAAAAIRFIDDRGETVAWEDRPAYCALVEGKACQRDDLTLLAADGRAVPVAVLAAPIRSDGSIIGAVDAIRDVTAQKRVQEDLRFHKRLLDAVGDAVVATRVDGTVLFWNRAAESLYGWSAQEAVGRDATDVMPSEVPREEGEAIQRRLHQGEPWSGVLQVRRRDGTAFFARVTNAPLLDETGRLVAILRMSRARCQPLCDGP